MRPFTTRSAESSVKRAPKSRWGVEVAPRRYEYGPGMSGEVAELRQPQDGASMAPDAEDMPSAPSRGPFSRLNEPDDARITGATRSLGRRLLGLNVAMRPRPVARDLGRALLAPAKIRTQAA